MKLVELTVKDYLDLLKSDAPAPGGGSVSALSAAQGIGLVAMVRISQSEGKDMLTLKKAARKQRQKQ